MPDPAGALPIAPEPCLAPRPLKQSRFLIRQFQDGYVKRRFAREAWSRGDPDPPRIASDRPAACRHRSGTNDKSATGICSAAALTGPTSAADRPAGCHWRAWLLAARAPGPAIERAGILRVSGTSLTSVFRVARRPVSGRGRLSAATNPHAATAVATILDVLRPHQSDRSHRTNIAIGSTAHLLFIRVENLPGRNVPGSIFAGKPWWNRCQGFCPYPPGGMAAIPRGG